LAAVALLCAALRAAVLRGRLCRPLRGALTRTLLVVGWGAFCAALRAAVLRGRLCRPLRGALTRTLLVVG